MPDERPVYDVLLDYLVFAPIGLVIEVVEELPKLTEKGRDRVQRDVTVARMLGRLAVGEAQRKVGRLFGPSEGVLTDRARPASEPSQPSPRAEARSDVRPSSARNSRTPSRPPRSSSTRDQGQGTARSQTSQASGRRSTSRPGAPPRPRAGAGDRKSTASTAAPAATVPTEASHAIVSAVLDEGTAVSGAESGGTRVAAEGRGHEAASALGVPDVASLAIPGYDTLAASQVVQRLGSLRSAELEDIGRYEAANRGRRTILHRISQLSAEQGRASA